MKKAVFNDYPNTAIKSVISEYVHNETHRRMLSLLLIDGKTYCEIADEFYVSEVAVSKVFNRYGNILIEKIKEVSE